jgi:L-alanine-DL-glutamate epimerase-like enolase superfamily enzyme
MRIEHIEAIPLDMDLTREFSGGTYKVRTRPTIVIRMTLENGIEAETYGGDEFHTQKQIVQVIKEHLAPMLVGQDVRDVQRLWANMFDYPLDLGNRGLHQLDMHPRGIILQAISALDNVMWDARGKLWDVPLWKLLGGCRDRVPVISIGGYYPTDDTDPCEAIAAEVDDVRAAGCMGIKMKVGRISLEEDLARVRAARKAGGDDFVLTVDANQGWSPRDAVKFCVEMEKLNLNVRWMEEPIKWWDQTDGLALLASKITTPINVGQGEITGQACRDLITKGKVDILNLDCTLCGGVTEWMRVAAMAKLMNVEMAHHEEPQVAVHLIAASPHATYVEIFANKLRDPLLWELPENFPDIKNGYMKSPETPGLGIKLKKDVIEKYRVDK